MKKNLGLIIIGVVFLVGIILILLTIHLNTDSECIYKGPLANVENTPCAADYKPATFTDLIVTDDDGFTKYETEDYTFNYPSNYILNDTNKNAVYLYAENNKDFLLIAPEEKITEVNQSTCADIETNLINSLSQFNAQSLGLHVLSIDRLKTCQVDYTANYRDENGELKQSQFYIDAKTRTYSIKITTYSNEANFENLEKIAKTFKINY